MLFWLRRNHLPLTPEERAVVRDGFWAALEPQGPDVVHELLRTNLKSTPGGWAVWETLCFADARRIGGHSAAAAVGPG